MLHFASFGKFALILIITTVLLSS